MRTTGCLCYSCVNKEKCLDDKMDILFDIMNNENDVFLANGEGIALRISDSYEIHYGVTAEDILGKSVYELEAEGVFNPSVTAAVLKEQKKVTILQKNNRGDNILTTGVPFFSDDGKIQYVISFNSIDIADMASQHEKYEKLNEMMCEYSSEIKFLKLKEFQEKTFITQSKSMADINELIVQVADVNANVLITGETGVGKSMIARLIHKISSRSEGSFIEINCGAIPPTLIESELFGYEKGAFTGADSNGKTGKIELANAGTLFLDEIGEFPLELQVKLLQVIQQKTMSRVGGLKKINVDFRLIAATNKDLETCIENGQFREDLYYRLNVISINIPTLRERRDDIVPLTTNFFERFNTLYKKKVSISQEALILMEQYKWPGNIRQLENLVERLVVTLKGDTVLPEHLPRDFRVSKPENIKDAEGTLTEIMSKVEKEVFIAAFEKHRTSVDVAKALGISQTTAARKLRKYVPDYVVRRFKENNI